MKNQYVSYNFIEKVWNDKKYFNQIVYKPDWIEDVKKAFDKENKGLKLLEIRGMATEDWPQKNGVYLGTPIATQDGQNAAGQIVWKDSKGKKHTGQWCFFTMYRNDEDCKIYCAANCANCALYENYGDFKRKDLMVCNASSNK